MSRATKSKRPRPLAEPPPALPISPLVGAAAVVRGVVEHVTPGGMVCLATASGHVWVLLHEIEMAAVPLDPDLFG